MLLCVTLEFHFEAVRQQHRVFYSHYGQANSEGLFSFIEGIDFSVATHDVISKWHILKESLFRARDLFIPSSLIYADSSPPWFNSEIRHQLNCIHTLRRKLKRNPSSYHISLRLHCKNSSVMSTLPCKHTRLNSVHCTPSRSVRCFQCVIHT